MKNKILILALALLTSTSVIAGNVYKSKKTTISFFSSTPVEDIEATSTKGGAAINFDNSKIFYKVGIKSFEFKNSLMQEHFNDNYMESNKYPNAQYSGKLNEKIDPNKNGEYTITTTGDLTIHGVTKKYTVPIKISVNNGKVRASATFDVKVADHDIEIPKIVVKKIAETVKVTVHADMVKN